MLDRSPGSAKDYIGYQALTQAAGLAVVRTALAKASKLGHLPGDHHFYVTFRTRTPGVQMADYLKDRFPEEMTIVIQHQYWDFEVQDDHFEIILKFSGVPQHLRVPFAALSRFYDPSVNFGMQFEASDAAAEALAGIKSLPGAAPAAQEPVKAAQDSTTSAVVAEPGADSTVVSLDAFRRK